MLTHVGVPLIKERGHNYGNRGQPLNITHLKTIIMYEFNTEYLN